MRLSLYIQILYPCILVRMGDFQEKLGQSRKGRDGGWTIHKGPHEDQTHTVPL